jgi:hypothetical protein
MRGMTKLSITEGMEGPSDHNDAVHGDAVYDFVVSRGERKTTTKTSCASMNAHAP